jgi:hypothetical protein
MGLTRAGPSAVVGLEMVRGWVLRRSAVESKSGGCAR